MFKRKSSKEALLQIRYYLGEESKHDLGYGICQGTLGCMQVDTKERLRDNSIGGGYYLFNGSIIEVKELEIPILHKGPNWGDLGIRVIAESEKILKKVTKELSMPFDRRAITSYDPKPS